MKFHEVCSLPNESANCLKALRVDKFTTDLPGYLIITIHCNLKALSVIGYYLLASAMIDTTKTDQAKAIGSLSTYKPVVRGPKIFPKDEPKLFIKTYVNPILVYPLQRFVAHPYTHATKYPKINVPAYKMALLASAPSTPKIKLIPST